MSDCKTEKASDGQSCDVNLKESAREETHALRPLPSILRGKSPEELKALEKRLIKKVDMRLLPTMILIYIMNYLDR